MQSLELSKQIMVVLDNVEPCTALATLDICRVLIKEKGFIAAGSQSPDSFWKLFQERQLSAPTAELMPVEIASAQ
jgi:hypothetical protein